MVESTTSCSNPQCECHQPQPETWEEAIDNLVKGSQPSLVKAMIRLLLLEAKQDERARILDLLEKYFDDDNEYYKEELLKDIQI